MGAKEFDYYVFIDYSENFLGYLIIKREDIKDFLPKISKFSHYNEVKHKQSYIHSIKKIIEKNNISSCPLKIKIRKTIDTPEIYSDILEFLKSHNNCLVFVSVDDKQYSNFERMVKVIDETSTRVIKESELKKNTFEHKISLVLDTLLNIERLKYINKQNN